MSPTFSRTMMLALILLLGSFLAIYSGSNKPSLPSTVASYALGD